MTKEKYSWQLKREVPYSSYLRFHKEYIPVYKRADFKCEVCRGNNCRLNVHHKDKKGYGKVEKPNNNLSNLLLVCSKCHSELHSQTRNGRREIILELIQQGWDLSAIGEMFGVSRQRIHQIKGDFPCNFIRR